MNKQRKEGKKEGRKEEKEMRHEHKRGQGPI
jgi:hypothetical protein